MKLSQRTIRAVVGVSATMTFAVEGFVVRPFAGVARPAAALKVTNNPFTGYQPSAPADVPKADIPPTQVRNDPFAGYQPSAPSSMNTNANTPAVNRDPFAGYQPPPAAEVAGYQASPQVEVSSEVSSTVSKGINDSVEDLLNLEREYENLKQGSMSIQIELKSEIVELKNELRKQASFLNLQVGELKDQLQAAETELDTTTRKFKAVGEAVEAKLKQENAAVTAHRDELLEKIQEMEDMQDYIAFAEKRDAELRLVIEAVTKERDEFRAKLKVLEETEKLLALAGKKEAELRQELQEMAKARDAALTHTQDLQATVEATKADFRKVNDAIIAERNEFQTQLVLLQETKELLAASKKREAELVQEMEKDRAEALQKTNELQATVDRTKAEFHQVNDAIIRERQEFEVQLAALQKTKDLLAASVKKEEMLRQQMQRDQAEASQQSDYLKAAVEATKEDFRKVNEEIIKERRQFAAQLEGLQKTKDLLAAAEQREVQLQQQLQTMEKERDQSLQETKELQASTEAMRVEFEQVNDAIIKERKEFHEKIQMLQKANDDLTSKEQREVQLINEKQIELDAALNENVFLKADAEERDAELRKLNEEIARERSEFQTQMQALQMSKDLLSMAEKRETDLRQDLQVMSKERSELLRELQSKEEKDNELSLSLKERLEQEHNERLKLELQVSAIDRQTHTRTRRRKKSRLAQLLVGNRVDGLVDELSKLTRSKQHP